MIGKKIMVVIGVCCICLLGGHVASATENIPVVPENQNGHQMNMHHDCPHSPMQKLIEPKLIELLQMDTKTFYTELGKGKSILQIAESKGLKKETLIDSIVKEMNMQIDAHVKDGHISKEKAVWLKKYLPVRAEMFITKPWGKCPGKTGTPKLQRNV